MCVIKPSAKPTEAGVWWQDDNQWWAYSLAHQKQIRDGVASGLSKIDLGSIPSSVHPRGTRYIANLREMVQVSVASGQRRPIVIIDTSSAVLQLNRPPQPTLQQAPASTGNIFADVHYRDSSGRLQKYDQSIARALLKAVVDGTQRSFIVKDENSDKYYFFDLEAMEQYVVKNFTCGELVLSDERPVTVVIEIPWNPVAMASLAADADAFMRRKVLGLVIERYRSDEHLDYVLPARAFPRTVVSKTPVHVSVPGHPEYEKFIDSLQSVLERSDQGVFRALIESADEPGGPVRLVFKPPGKSSSSSSKRERAPAAAAFWLTMAAPLAAAQAVVCGCAVQLKICVYLAILPAIAGFAPEQQCSNLEGSGYVQVERPEHRLHLAEVLVC